MARAVEELYEQASHLPAEERAELAGKLLESIEESAETAKRAGKRPMGLAKGDFVVPDDFDDPLPEDVLQLFEGE